MNSDYKKAIDIRREFDLNKKVDNLRTLREFLYRFIKAANSHVELVDLIDEGTRLLEETNYYYDGVAAE